MQVISFMAIKGGVGKTTMAFQFAKYLQENNKSTLLIDLDSQKSLTGTFETKDFNFKYKHNIGPDQFVTNHFITKKVCVWTY